MPSLVENGIIAGVGSVLVFAPTIFILFFLMHALEDTGYVARISVLMDGIMGRTGLSGRAFIPLALGFGCNVPAIMATRILDTRQDRLATMAAIPFMSCSARLPVFTILAGAFFAGFEGSVLLFLYLFGVASGLATVFLFRRLVSRSGKPELAIELPDYQVPSWRTVFSQAWLETSEFVRRAGTIILASAVLIWFLASMPYGVEYGSRESFAGMLGSAIAPVFAPLGFGTWQSSISLLFGFVAKEVVVGAMASAYAAPEGELSSHLASHFSPLSAFSLMLFVLLYVPCLATLAALKKESKSISFTLGAAAYYMAFAWAVSFIVYNAGLALGF
jgi:ferrous iron transport protein B